MLKKLWTKRIAVFLSAFLIISAMPFGFAEGGQSTSVKALVKCGSVTLSGTAGANAKVVATVIESGTDTFVFADDTEADKTGAFEFPVFAMPDVEDSSNSCGGEYVIKINANGEVLTKTFIYFGIEKRAELINKINSAADDAALNTLLCANRDILNEFGFVTDGITEDNAALFKTIADKIPFSTDEQRFCDAMSEILLIDAVNNLKADEFGEFLKENDGRGINLLFGDIKISDDSAMYAEVCKYASENRPYKSVSDLNEQLYKGAVLYLLNNASKLTLAETVKKYNEYIGITAVYLRDYTNTESASRDISGRVLDKMNGAKFKSLSEFNKVLCEQIDEYKTANKNNSSSGGSGSGGSSGGSSVGGASQYPIQNNTESESVTERYDKDITDVFKDTDDVDWAKDAISALYKKGIISGRTSDSFEPNSPITREEFIKILLGVLEIKPIWNMTAFKDVDKDAWYYDWVSTAEKFGITNGISNDLFGTGNNITREEAAATLMRGCSAVGIAIDSNADNKTNFSDYGEISEWAITAVSDLSSAGIINGRDNNRFEPQDTITRAESAKLLYGILKLRSTGGSL